MLTVPLSAHITLASQRLGEVGDIQTGKLSRNKTQWDREWALRVVLSSQGCVPCVNGRQEGLMTTEIHYDLVS